jgi:sugar phosphate permease
VAYLGAACAGVPLSLIVKYYGWGAFFAALLTACAAAFLLLAPMVNAASWGQKQAKLA